MKLSKGVYATRTDIELNLSREYKLFNRKIIRERVQTIRYEVRNFTCQFDYKRSNLVCTCKKFLEKEGHANSARRNYMNIGIGDVKACPRKRVKRIYLPETVDTGIGSADLSPYIYRRTKNHRYNNYYEHKRTSSKCVGNMGNYNMKVLSKQLSPIIQTRSGTTSPKDNATQLNNTDRKVNTVNTVSTQVDEELYGKETIQVDNPDTKQNSDTKKAKKIVTEKNIVKDFSSDSLVQHVYDLEVPSDRRSALSIDPMENKLEREYRKIFTTGTKEKQSMDNPIPDFKTASLLRRRFEAFRHGIDKKESKQGSLIIKTSSRASVAGRKDVSIASDPPSLEGRSYSYTKPFSPFASIINQYKTIAKPKASFRKSFTGKDKITTNSKNMDSVDSEYQGVKGMFRLWGKKFNLDDSSKSIVPEVNAEKPEEKKNGAKKEKKILFFKRKPKVKDKDVSNPKGLTAGRCEVYDHFAIKSVEPNEKPIENKQEDQKDILNKAWFRKYLTSRKESANSLKIRWNNRKYGTSSSTVFELMENLYKNQAILMRSKSEVSTVESYESFRRYNHRHNQRYVNFPQTIEAFMVPDIRPKPNLDLMKEINHINLIDSLKCLSRFEIVLQANNYMTIDKHRSSSNYIIIDIPKGYFSEKQSSDEQVYNIVEYENVKSSSILKRNGTDHIPGFANKDTEMSINFKKNNNERHKLDAVKVAQYVDVSTQRSYRNNSKHLGVVGVGIITQRDIRDIRKPILKIQEDFTDDDSEPAPKIHKKCEFAESYLQDYYRNWWIPMGINLYSWCVSDSQVRCSSGNSVVSFQQQGDGSNSCPNIYDDYQTSTAVLSCCDSACSGSEQLEVDKKAEETLKDKLFNTFKRKAVPIYSEAKRVQPKDSYEVLRRRKVYAMSNKSKWRDNSETHIATNINERDVHDNVEEYKSVSKCVKHSKKPLPSNSAEKPEGIVTFKGTPACNTCKKNEQKRSKHARVIPEPICEIPPIPCKESCENEDKPFCLEKNTPPCDETLPGKCPVSKNSCPPKPLCEPAPEPPTIQLPRIASKCNNESVSGPPILQLSRKPSPKCIKITAKESPCTSPPCSSPTPQSKTPIEPSSPCSQLIEPSLCKTPSPNPSNCEVFKNIPPCMIAKPKQHDENYESQMPSRGGSPPNRHRHAKPKKKRSPTSSLRKHTHNSHLPKCDGAQENTPPCSRCVAPSCNKCEKPGYNNDTGEDIPRPLKNSASRESGISLLTMSPDIDKKKCPSTTRTQTSCEFLKDKEIDCPEKPKVCSRPTSPTHISTPQIYPKKCNNMPKDGLFLKKDPSKKKDCVTDICPDGIIRLNSKENITIQLKQQTPSTEEIREQLNIKVQDEDGQTLYERRDYRQNNDKKSSLLRDMYKDSQVHRIAAPNNTVKGIEENENNSDTSVSNLIEINFTIKFKQGDKGTEVDIKNDSDKSNNKHNVHRHSDNTCKEVYVAQNNENSIEHSNKNDVNIKVIIKNYNSGTGKSEKLTNKVIDEDFARNISEKFNTVSTGYSDMLLEHHTYSVHRATIDLNSPKISNIKFKNSEDLVDEYITNQEPINFMVSSHSLIVNSEDEDINIAGNYLEENDENFVLKIDESKKNNLQIKCHNIDFNKNPPKPRNKEEKKEMLKKVFETSSDVIRNKEQIKRILHSILDSDSGEMGQSVASNGLVKEITFESLKANYLGDTDSMNNYYKRESGVSIRDQEKIVLPTEDNSESSESDSETINKGHCLCSTFAAKLMMSGLGDVSNACGCRNINRDEEINCDLEREYFAFKSKTECFDVEDVKLNSILNLQLPDSVTNSELKVLEDKLSEKLTPQINTDSTYIMQKIYTSAILGETSVEKKVVLSNPVTCTATGSEIVNYADILQSHEIKKAVLEIYAEKTVSNGDERLVAKLPKFVYDKERDIKKIYQGDIGNRRISKRNVVMMSIYR